MALAELPQSEVTQSVPINWKALFHPRVGAMVEASRPVDKLLGVSPEATNFAGGYPARAAFPSLELMGALAKEAGVRYPDYLQYGKAAGTDAFLDILIGYLREQQTFVGSRKNVAVTSGSQGGLRTLGELFLSEEGTKVAVSNPVYLGLRSAWSKFRPEWIIVESDDKGPRPDSLDKAFQRGAVIAYMVANFDNPTGVTVPIDRRREIIHVHKKYGRPLIEDDPYRWLRYRGTHLPSIQDIEEDAWKYVIYLTSLSKVAAPGLRIGAINAPPEVIEAMVAAKPDLCTGNFVQAVASVFIEDGHIWAHIERINKLYAPRHDTMLEAVHKYFPGWVMVGDPEGPEGGMFLWLIGPEGTDVSVIFEQAREQNVAILEGAAFCVDPSSPLAKRAIRLNYTNQPEDLIVKGIKTVGDIARRLEQLRAPVTVYTQSGVE